MVLVLVPRLPELAFSMLAATNPQYQSLIGFPVSILGCLGSEADSA